MNPDHGFGVNPRTAADPGADGAGSLSVDAAIAAIEAAVSLVSPPQGETRGRTLPATALAARLADAAAVMEASGRVDVMPLVHELEITAQWLAAGRAVRDAQTAVSAALGTLRARLRGDAGSHWDASQLAAIVNLRSLRREALLFTLPEKGVVAAEPDEPLPADAVARVLPAFRTGLLGLFKQGLQPATTVLADACRDLGGEAAAGADARRWRQAAEMFGMSSGSAAAELLLAVTRLAARLESLLRCVFAPESEIGPGERAQIWQDVDVLHALMCRLEAGVETASARSSQTQIGAIGTACSKQALDALEDGADLADGLKALRDALLREGRYERWFEVRKLERDEADPETALRRLSAWEAPPATVGHREIPALVHDHFARAEAALQRLESETLDAEFVPEPVPAGETKASVARSDLGLSPIAVDEALLENLNLAAAEIRGARSRAEANLGSLRGGLQDMERTIRTLRAQLEALELDSSAAAESETRSADRQIDDAPSRLGALSRGIEELQGLQDALHALTEDTESVLASQASEDSELEHGLLKTRLVPVSTQFERWTEAVGTGMRLDIDGGEALLERRQAAALSDALVPLLADCVAGAGHIAIDISRPRFDLLLQVRFAGPPIAPAIWAGLSAAFEKLGAFASQHDEAPATAVRIVVPGPPQSLDVVLVELGGQRFALPVDGVAGVLRRPKGVAGGDDLENVSDAESRSLAALLGVPETPVPPGMEPTNHVLLAGESRQPVACRVDAIRQRERVLVRSPGPLLANNPWILAVIVNEHAPPTLVLDLPALVPALIATAAPA